MGIYCRSGPGEGGDEPPIRFVGDELDLYADYHFELVKKIARDVQYVSPENAEDACAHAWLKFLQRQPDRDGAARGIQSIPSRRGIPRTEIVG